MELTGQLLGGAFASKLARLVYGRSASLFGADMSSLEGGRVRASAFRFDAIAAARHGSNAWLSEREGDAPARHLDIWEKTPNYALDIVMDDSPYDSAAPAAGAPEIEVTDGMIDAGVRSLLRSCVTDHPLEADRLVVSEIFQAMLDSARREGARWLR